MAEAAPPHTQKAPEGGGGVQAQRGCPPGWGLGGMNGDTVAEAPHLRHNPEEGAESAGPDWKQMGPPCQAGDTRSTGRGGWEGGGEGGAAPPRQPIPAVLLPPCGFENSRAETGTREAPGVLGARRGVWRGAETLKETRGLPQGAGSPSAPTPGPGRKSLVPPLVLRIANRY